MRSAKGKRPGAEFFVRPSSPAQRRYEVLRAYLVEGLSAREVAQRFELAEGTVAAVVRDFRRGERPAFVERRPGPRSAPGKDAARAEVLRLRALGHSVTEIADALAAGATPLNRTGVWEILRDEGHERLAQRPPGRRGGPRRERLPRAARIDWPEQPVTVAAEYAGALLLVPGLIALDLPGAVRAAGLPGTRVIPALCSVLSLLALKLIGRRRISHVDDVCHDPALALLAGLGCLPKATALGTYSYRLSRAHHERLLAALAPAMQRTGQAPGRSFDVDFHAIMHYGDDVALETHYVPRRSQRTESVLTFFAQDGDTHNLVYANATCTKATQADEVLAFARHWQQATGGLPELLVFDSKVTTGAGLYRLHQAGIRFLTLRQRNAKLTAALHTLPDSAWTQITLDRHGPHNRPQVHEHTVTVRGCPVALRQIAVRGLGHEHATLILTNHDAPAKALVARYAQRMTIEQRLAESIRSFHLDALSSAVALNVDLDTTLTVCAQLAYDDLRRRLPGYQTATPDTIWRRFTSTRGRVTIGPHEVTCQLARRTYSPVLRAADLPDTEIPWWGGRRLRIQLD